MSRGAKEVVFLYAGGLDHVVGMGIGSSSVAIPDSRTLWDLIWEHREVITEIGHSHPVGPGALSGTDIETAEGVVKALGKPIYFSVVHPGGYVRKLFSPTGQHGPVERPKEPWWASLLWDLSQSFEPKTRPRAVSAGEPT